MNTIASFLERPGIAIGTSSGAVLTGWASTLIERVAPLAGALAGIFACITAGCVAAVWIRKTIRIFALDIRRARARRKR
ncbi:hypothetical protein OpiT1DRAFT_03836 [Opitutaceae bacterium TAV1]|nr:hypothetical protein OpiT1DRAFT_03836 [Opitutaceae bacterium TAV1]